MMTIDEILKELNDLKNDLCNNKNIDYSIKQNFDWFHKIVINYIDNKQDEFINLNKVSPLELFEMKIIDIKNKISKYK